MGTALLAAAGRACAPLLPLACSPWPPRAHPPASFFFCRPRRHGVVRGRHGALPGARRGAARGGATGSWRAPPRDLLALLTRSPLVLPCPAVPPIRMQDYFERMQACRCVSFPMRFCARLILLCCCCRRFETAAAAAAGQRPGPAAPHACSPPAVGRAADPSLPRAPALRRRAVAGPQ